MSKNSNKFRKTRNETTLYETIRLAAAEGRGVRLSILETKFLAAQPFIKSEPWLLNLKWRRVPGYEEYEVSSEGHVRRGVRPIKPTSGNSGHLKVTLYNGSMHGAAARGWSTHIHRLVALSFIGPAPSPNSVVRHLNGHPSDNRVENLRWGTAQENVDDMRRHFRNGKPPMAVHLCTARGGRRQSAAEELRKRTKAKMLQRLARMAKT